MHLAPSQRTLDEDASLPFCAGRKLGEVDKALLWTLLQEDAACPSRVFLAKAAQMQTPLSVSVRPLHRWRATWQGNRRRGRPRQAPFPPTVASGAAVVQRAPRLSCVGVHLLAHWLAQHEAFGPVVARLTQAIQDHKHAYPDDDFALVHHREQTLLRRFQALFFAPLCGIETLTAFATHEHPLGTLRGRGEHSAPLSQFLGQRERVEAAKALMPALVPAPASQITSVDGPMIASWAKVSMHTGQITMLGRIMAGSQAVIAHNEAGHALFVESHPPDMHLSPLIVASCQKVAMATGTSLCVIDRAVHAVAMAAAFDAQELGLLCMLDDHEHHGLESFEAPLVGALDDGTSV